MYSASQSTPTVPTPTNSKSTRLLVSRGCGSNPKEIMSTADGSAASAVAVHTYTGVAVVYIATAFEGSLCWYC